MSKIIDIFNDLKGPIGGLGFLFWLASFNLSPWLKEKHFINLSDFTNGYTFGFATAISGVLALRIITGKEKLILLDEDHLYQLTWLICLLIILLTGLAGFVIDIFGNTTWQYNIGYYTGASIMSFCFWPIINDLDISLKR